MDDAERKAKRNAIQTRIRNSTKPTFLEKKPVFFRCPHCGNLAIQETVRNKNFQMHCCDHAVEPLIIQTDIALAPEHMPFIQISGGFSANVAKVSVGAVENPHPMNAQHHIEWIYLYTFQGGQFKYLKPTQEAALVLALAEEDSYVYCDKAACQKCKFNCKRGFTAYAYCNVHGLWCYQM